MFFINFSFSSLSASDSGQAGQAHRPTPPVVVSSQARLLEGFVGGLQRGSQTVNRLGETFYETIATCKHW